MLDIKSRIRAGIRESLRNILIRARDILDSCYIPGAFGSCNLSNQETLDLGIRNAHRAVKH